MSIDWHEVRCDVERARARGWVWRHPERAQASESTGALLERGVRAFSGLFAMLSGGEGASSVRRLPLFCLVLCVGVLVATASSAAPPPPLPVLPGGGFLDGLVDKTDGTYIRWMSTAKAYAGGLFGPLFIMQVVLTGREARKACFFDAMCLWADLVMRKGFWAYFILNAESIGPAIFQGIEHVGKSIAGSNLQAQPMEYVDIGRVTLINLGAAAWKGGLLAFGPTTFIAMFGGACVLLVFSFAGWVLALTLMYVKVVAVGGLFLVGLAGLDITAKYGWNYLEFMVRGGLKQLGVILVLGLAASYTQQWRIMAESAAFPGAELHTIALSMLTDGVGLLFLLLLVPQITSSIASGGIGDAGEGKLIGAATGLSQAAAAMGVGWAISRFGPGASPGPVSAPNSGATPEQRAQMLVQAAASSIQTPQEQGAPTQGGGSASAQASDVGPEPPPMPQGPAAGAAPRRETRAGDHESDEAPMRRAVREARERRATGTEG